METREENAGGLTTREALLKLITEIEQVMWQFENSRKSRKCRSYTNDALNHRSQNTTINYASAGVLFVTAFCLLLSYFAFPTFHSHWFLYQCAIVALLLAVGVAVEVHDKKLRHEEVTNRVRAVLKVIKSNIDRVQWNPENYPQLFSPISPCITLQWTYRDNKLVNLPWALLVKGDVILIRPGQMSPGYCESLDKSNEFQLLHSKQVFAPTLHNANEIFSVPKARKPLQNKRYRLLETPFLNNLHVALEQSLSRPVTQFNQQRDFVMVKVIERTVFPVFVLAIYLVDLMRYFYVDEAEGGGKFWELFVLTPVKIALPLLPLVFPLMWNGMNYVGMARFRTLFDQTSKMHIQQSFEEENAHMHLTTKSIRYSSKSVWTNFWKITRGDPEIMCRSANILHAFGSVSALCCVDKKGILSWPNPIAEKVFFLRNPNRTSENSSLANLNEMADCDSGDAAVTKADSPVTAIAEVLDLTHHHDNPFEVHFDDTSWKKHLTSLKPLGLGILLNTCNLDTQEHYAGFCSHITCEAMYNEHVVPVTNRRCLCALATEMGFVDQALKIFSLEQQLCSYRHLQPEMVRRDNKYARSLQLSTKLKFPFPHVFATVVREQSSDAVQLLSEGTADIILDSCVDFWDGNDLCALSTADRRRIQDFYQRSSLTAYCTAFSYRPLNKSMNKKVSEFYLELPSDCRHLYINQRSPTPIRWDYKSVLEPQFKVSLGNFYSTDSLLCPEGPTVEASEAETCFEMQCNQIFIGMVTMQYQVITDMVHLIEQLERACIRFVHFSKENELRSRVFSEKMGLESGWNCHISLLSERATRPQQRQGNQERGDDAGELHRRKRYCSSSHLESSRTMSFSAPCAINVEQPTVKFDTEHEQLVLSDDEHQVVGSDESLRGHDWQSLSCLTDSTDRTVPINFDMSNRAKLPRGIDKIRPHIEMIDNVPLLVSLFTDCTSAVTQEMLHIMQDYGEVVCVMGSAANCENIGIFMQADASIAVEPLYPQVCQKELAFKPSTSNKAITPTDLSRLLNSIACSLSFRRDEPLSIFHLIMEARQYMTLLWSSVQFFVSGCLFVSFAQLAAALFLLPPLLSAGQVLWFVCAVLPLLALALVATPTDPEVMKKPAGKNQVVFNVEVLIFVLWCYGLKFLPVLLTVLISYGGILSSHCASFCELTTNCSCVLYVSWKTDLKVVGVASATNSTLLLAQQVIVVIIFVHFVIISMGFVHREYLIWERGPHKNLLWMGSVFLLSCFQFVFTAASVDVEGGFQVPLWVAVFAAASPLITFLVNEVVKYQEIQVNKRFQRRARLDFGTKLGMNSPF